MTEKLITDLAKIRALRVISRSSVMPYKGSRKPLREIARELHADAPADLPYPLGPVATQGCLVGAVENTTPSPGSAT